MDIRKKSILRAGVYLQKHKPKEFRVKMDNNMVTIYQRKMDFIETRNGVRTYYHWESVQKISLLKDVEF